MNKLVLIIAVALLFVETACKRDEITSTLVPKENAQVAVPQGKHDHKEIEWTQPAAWVAQPLTGMRVGSFLYTSSEGQKVDISVTRLQGDGGGDLANINRWRGQIQLDPLDQMGLEKSSNLIKPAGRPMLFVNYVSAKPLMEGRHSRVAGAIFHTTFETWFFKLSGEDKTVLTVLPEFSDFLASLRFAHE